MHRFALRASKPLFTEAKAAATLPTPPNPLAAGACAKSCAVTNLFKAPDQQRIFVISSGVMALSLPASIVLAQTSAAYPFELALAVSIPYHMWYGTMLVMQDYVPKGLRPAAINAWGAVAAISAMGLFRIANGPGIGYSIRSLWREAPKKRLD